MNNDIIKVIKSNKLATGLLNKWGGQWLGCMRKWIKSEFWNGDVVTWGSDDYLSSEKRFTVSELEQLAGSIANATLLEFKEHLVTEEQAEVLKVFLDKRNWDGNIFKPDTDHMDFFLAHMIKHQNLQPWELDTFQEKRNAERSKNSV